LIRLAVFLASGRALMRIRISKNDMDKPLRIETDKLDRYIWSSHMGYTSKAEKWNWLHKNFVFSMLSKIKDDRLEIYRQFVPTEVSSTACSGMNGVSVISAPWIRSTRYDRHSFDSCLKAYNTIFPLLVRRRE